ncbi:MAG: TolC family outer membrane protein [Betaproteobacteria bacterium]|nr:TolC family outer membrane protein [Betaproteobacteria bacterium]MBK8919338.1 TolC family outer membrane protein [Betaproteobacteria bacterium]
MTLLRRMACVALLAAGPAFAADLLQVYREAQDNDPTYAGARATADAGREKLAQGRAGLLPSLTLSGTTVWNENELSVGSNTVKPRYNSNSYTATLSQPLFRWQNWVQYGQGKYQAALAEAQLQQARQDLILRVAQAYFDVLYAEENLRALEANKTAIAQQLESAKKNFEVGTSTITDTHEAQARYDLAVAQEIGAQSDLEVRRRALQAIIGREPGTLAQVKAEAKLLPPVPAEMSKWVEAAESGSITVQIQQANAEIASLEVDKQRAGHYPTLDVVANAGRNNSVTSGVPSNSLETDFRNIGLQLSLPIFQGGLVLSRDREAVANRAAAQAALEAARRASILAARQYYLGVVNGLAQLRALAAAKLSSQSALESNKLGYEVGVRINIDVLNAENQVYQTRRDFARAALDTLMAQLKLKAAVGALGEDDLAQANALLDPATVR